MPEVMAEYKNWSNRISLCPSGYFNSDYCFNFRASLGPEAALVGIIGGLCTWVGIALNLP